MKKNGHKGFLLDDWWVSPPEGLLVRGNETVRIEPKTMEVLVYFASRPGEVITREALEREVWRGAMVGYDAVTSTILKLRKALHDDARKPRFIATIPKMGYQLIATISYPENDTLPHEPATPISSEPVVRAQRERRRHSRFVNRTGILIAALAVILLIGWVWLWPSGLSPITSVIPTDSKNSDMPPSIIVLPFDNLGNDPKQDYLADGITEDIITDLSRLSSLLVIASNTSSKYKDRQVTPEEVGADLNVAFVLKGSIRQLGDEIRVNAQLVNTKTGFNAWAQRYDRKVTEVFAVQDDVTRSIVEALAIKMTSQEKQRVTQKATGNLEAYDFFHEGQKLSHVSTRETNRQARVLYRKAIELDPNYGRAYGAMAVSLAFDFRNGWTDEPIETLDQALALAKKAVALDDSTPQTYWALSFVYLMRKEYENAEKAAEESIRVAPNYADGYGMLALIKISLGKPEQAIEINAKGMRLNPYYTFHYLYNQGSAYFMLGNYNAAINALEKAQSRNPNAVHVLLFLTASYVKDGRQNEAKWIIEQLKILSPMVNLTSIDNTIPMVDSEYKSAFLESLRKAGLPE
jgi:TolB-like protein/DNA-binding winged helix-turn-helix (wHTH) protein/Flp pilus assembly protein TadD